MKSAIKTLILGSALAFAGQAGAAIVSLNFTNIAPLGGGSTLISSAGDTWVATNVRASGGPQMDAHFTITSFTGGGGTSNVAFVDEVDRGNNMRIRFGQTTRVEDAAVQITIRLYDAGTTTPYTGFVAGDTLVTQFQDIDSDANRDRSDFAGSLTGSFTGVRTSDDITPNSSLLNVQVNPTFAPAYTVGILDEPWGPQVNVTSPGAGAQSAVTVAFDYTALTTIQVVVGQQSNGATAERVIDIDMTPDFFIIPEPSVALLGGLGFLALLRRRR